MKKRILKLFLALLLLCISVISTYGCKQNSVSVFIASDRHGENKNLMKILSNATEHGYSNLSTVVLAGDTFNGQLNVNQNNDNNPPPEIPNEDNHEEDTFEQPVGRRPDKPDDDPPKAPQDEENTYDDTEGKISEDFNTAKVTDAINSITGINVNCYYTYGTHDDKDDENFFTGPIDLDDAYLYGITFDEMTDFNTAEIAAEAFWDWTGTLTDTNKPIIIVSHVPLHKRRGDNAGGGIWTTVINNAAKAHNILFLWGHNHTGEDASDTNAYYLEKGDYISSEGNSMAVKLNFTYANAGYLQMGYGSVVTAYSNGTMEIHRYSVNGLESTYLIDAIDGSLPSSNDLFENQTFVIAVIVTVSTLMISMSVTVIILFKKKRKK